MVVLPTETLPTVPELFTVATAVLLLFCRAASNCISRANTETYAHRSRIWSDSFGALLTVTGDDEVQPVKLSVNEMLGVPPETPVTLPDAFTVAREVLLLAHVPAPAPSVYTITFPGHTLEGPVGAAGLVLIVSVIRKQAEGAGQSSSCQPSPVINNLVAVTAVATDVALLLHVPPAGVEFRVVVVPRVRDYQ